MGRRAHSDGRRRTPKRPTTSARAGVGLAEPARVPARAATEPTSQASAGIAAEAAAVADDPEPVALVVSHRFDSGDRGTAPYTATLRITGRRRSVTGRSTPADSFARMEQVTGVVPGSGPVAVTTWVHDIAPGEWDTTAEIVGPEWARLAHHGKPLPAVSWSWRRWSMAATTPGAVHTRRALLAPFAAIPAVLPGSFTLLAVVAIIGAFATQVPLLGQSGVDVGSGIAASLAGLVVGIAGAKAWYMALKGASIATLKEGWSVDGFLVAAPLAAVLAALGTGTPLGPYLDAITPGIFVAVAIGRVGCFLTGCCTGRWTASRWGVWSSDRRVGARRIPAQLIESATGIVLAIVSAAAVLGQPSGGRGFAFVGAVGAYAIARQVLLRMRAESRRFSWQRSRTAAQAGA